MVIWLSSDLVEDILSWVPSRSLVRLKYTCKQWKTLIENPRFFNKHLSRMRCRDQQFTIFNKGYTVFCVGMDFDEIRNPCLNLEAFKPVSAPGILLVQDMYHCDGLLLLVMRSKLIVLNPLLKQARQVTCSYGTDRSLDAYGLGYISNQSNANDYRIVRFPCSAPNGGKYKGTKIGVYEFKSDSWRGFVDESFDGFYGMPLSSVCLKGTPYWIGYFSGKIVPTIHSFDFSKERFETLFLPPSSSGSPSLENYLSLGVFRGDKLSLLHKSRPTGKIHLWVKKKHWSKMMTVAIPEFASFHKSSSFFIENNGKLVLSICDIKSIKIYTVGKDGEWQNVKYPSMNSIGSSTCYYVPSLLQIPGFSRRKEQGQVFIKKRRFLTMDST